MCGCFVEICREKRYSEFVVMKERDSRRTEEKMDWKILALLVCVDGGLCIIHLKTQNDSWKFGRNFFEFFLYFIVIMYTVAIYVFRDSTIEQIFNRMLIPFTTCVSASGMCNCLEGMLMALKKKEEKE